MSHSARLVLGFWWVFIILVLSTYTASLAAVLTVNIYEKSISSLSELAEQTSITPLIKPGTNLQTLFQVWKYGGKLAFRSMLFLKKKIIRLASLSNPLCQVIERRRKGRSRRKKGKGGGGGYFSSDERSYDEKENVVGFEKPFFRVVWQKLMLFIS